MTWVTLEQAKAHLRVLHSHDDAYINQLIDIAAQHMLDYTDRADDDPLFWSGSELKAPIMAAMLLLIGDLYANREAQTAAELRPNPAFERLLWSYRRLGVL
jgi:hypothetical protein